MSKEKKTKSKLKKPSQKSKQKKKAEIALRDSENIYSSLAENSGDYIMRYDKNCRHIYANKAAIKVTGIPKKDYIGKTHREMGIFPKHLCDLWEKGIRIVFRTGKPHQEEFQWTGGDNKTYYLDWRLFPEFADKKVKTVLGVSRDITEKMKAEEALKESEEKFKTWIEHSPICTKIVDLDLNLLYMSPAGVKTLKIDDISEFYGKKYPLNIYPKPYDKIMHEKIMKCIKTGEIMEQDSPVLDTDGNEIWYHATFVPVKDDKGKVKYLLIVSDNINERKKAEEELRIKNDAIESSINAIGMADLEGKMIYVNDSCVKMWGYQNKSEIIGKSIFDFWKGDGIHETIKALKEKGEGKGEDIGKRKDGSLFDVQFSANVVNDENGKPLCIMGAFIDITEMKKAEEALRKSVKKFRALTEYISDGVSVVDANGTTVYESESLERMLGHTAASQIGANVFSLIHPEDYDTAEKAFNSILNKPGSSQTILLRVIDGEGVYHWMECIGTNLIDDPAVEGIVINYHDVTENKKAEDALRESEKKYRTIIENMPDMYYQAGLDGKLIMGNERGLKLLGYESIDDLEGINLKDLYFNPEERDHFVHKLMSDGKVENYEVTLKGSDGQPVYVEVNSQFILDEKGTPVGVEGVARDISKRVHLEKIQEQLNQQLLQAQKMEAIGSLAGGIAHDFNNILTAINGYCQLILPQVKDNPVVTHDIKEIKNVSKRAASMTHQLLAFSRKQVLSSQILDINSVIRDTKKMLNRLIGEDIKLVTDLDPDLEETKTDLSQFEQIIMNLAVNARDAMPEGGKLTIITRNETVTEKECESLTDVTPGRFIRVTVRDTGIGMNPEVTGRIFEPFFSTKPMGKGTGLGLSMVYGIIHQQNGFVSVITAPGEGTEFHIFLPVIETKGKYKKKKSDTFVKYAGKGERILLVEDEKGARDVGVRILFEAGYTVDEAEDAETALNIFEKNKDDIDIIISDVVLPGMSGLDLIDMVLELKPDIGVILCSGYTDERSRIEKIEAKGYDFIQKPYEIAEFLETISNVLMNRKS